jgi:zinc protease
MKTRLFVVLLVLAIVLPAWAAKDEQSLPKDLPPYGQTKPAPVPNVQQDKLPNGQTVWMVPRPGFPKVTFEVAVRGGYSADPKDKPGISEFLTGAIDQGTKTRNAKQIAEQMQATGGDLTASPTPDGITVSASVLADKSEQALAVLADIVQNATFPDAEVEIARQNLAESLERRESDPNFLARRAFYKAAYGDFPYSVIAPTKDSIARTTATDLRSEYARRFRPDHALLVIVGDFDPARMKALVQTAFGKWTNPNGPAVPELDKPAQNVSRTLILVPRPGSVQTTFMVGALGPIEAQPDYAAARVANALYGGMFGSRLTKNIREDKGYTYSPYSAVGTARYAATMRTYAAVRNEVTGATWNEISYEMNRMATTSPNKDELERAQRYLVGNIALGLQSQSELADRLGQLWLTNLPPEELGAQSEKIQKVTAADVDAAGKKYFPSPRMAVIAVGDEKVIKEQLGSFGLELKPVQN